MPFWDDNWFSAIRINVGAALLALLVCFRPSTTWPTWLIAIVIMGWACPQVESLMLGKRLGSLGTHVIATMLQLAALVLALPVGENWLGWSYRLVGVASLLAASLALMLWKEGGRGVQSPLYGVESVCLTLFWIALVLPPLRTGALFVHQIMAQVVVLLVVIARNSRMTFKKLGGRNPLTSRLFDYPMEEVWEVRFRGSPPLRSVIEAIKQPIGLLAAAMLTIELVVAAAFH